MNTNEYRGDSEPLRVLHSARNTVERTDQGPELDRAEDNRVFTGNSRSGAVAAAIASPRPFPLHTLIVCFTIWLIAAQAMIFDQIKFEMRARLVDQAARSFGVPQVVVPTDRPANPPASSTVQRL